MQELLQLYFFGSARSLLCWWSFMESELEKGLIEAQGMRVLTAWGPREQWTAQSWGEDLPLLFWVESGVFLEPGAELRRHQHRALGEIGQDEKAWGFQWGAPFVPLDHEFYEILSVLAHYSEPRIWYHVWQMVDTQEKPDEWMHEWMSMRLYLWGWRLDGLCRSRKSCAMWLNLYSFIWQILLNDYYVPGMVAVLWTQKPWPSWSL